MRTALVSLLIFSSFCLYANDNRKLSEFQNFIVPDDAPNGEYVGILKAFPNIEAEGTAASFTLLENKNGIYSLNSTGLITIQDNTSLTAGIDIIKAVIQKEGFSNDTIEISISVLDATGCTFINTEATTNGTGTRNNPLNIVPSITANNTILLFKRGTAISRGTVYVNGITGFMAASYGEGALPVLQSTTSFFRIYGGCHNPVIRDLEFTTPEPERSSPTHSPSTNQYYTNWGGSVYASSHTGTLKVEHCVMHHLTNGITDVSPDNNDGENSSHKWNTIYDIAQEGIFCKLISGTTELSCNKLERINLIWFHDQTEQISSGDGIQTYQTHTTVVEHNYIDRTFTGNKFCIIVDTYSTGTNGEGNATEPVSISSNYLKGTHDNTSSILIYGYFLNGVIEKNFGDTCDYFVMTGVSSDITYKYNIIKRGQIRDATADVYNNIFIGPVRCLTNGFGADIFKNNITYLTGVSQTVYTDGQVADASNNLYNIEQADMFGAGNSSVSAIESNSIVGDPVFYKLENNIFWLTENSPAIDNGVLISSGTDYYNHEIDERPNIGISEYVTTATKAHSAKNNETDKIIVYPNPAINEQINIRLSNTNEYNFMHIYDLTGKLILKKKITNKDIQINHPLSPGIYTVKLIGLKRTKALKIMVN